MNTAIDIRSARAELDGALKLDVVVAAQLCVAEVQKLDPETMTAEEDALLVDRMGVMGKASRELEQRKSSILRPFQDAVAGLRSLVQVEIDKIEIGRRAGDVVTRRRKQLRREAEERAAAAARAATEAAAQRPVQAGLAPPPAVVAPVPSSRRIEGSMTRAVTRKDLMIRLADPVAFAQALPTAVTMDATKVRTHLRALIALDPQAKLPGVEHWFEETEVYQQR